MLDGNDPEDKPSGYFFHPHSKNLIKSLFFKKYDIYL
jgi:hypothetical protein